TSPSKRMWPVSTSTSPSITGYVFFRAAAGIRVFHVTGVQTCALPIYLPPGVEFEVHAETDLQLARGGAPAAKGAAARLIRPEDEIGRASCRERAEMWVVAVRLSARCAFDEHFSGCGSTCLCLAVCTWL